MYNESAYSSLTRFKVMLIEKKKWLHSCASFVKVLVCCLGEYHSLLYFGILDSVLNHLHHNEMEQNSKWTT